MAMTICESCGEKFDVDKTRAKYNKAFGGDPDYDHMYESERCASCAIQETEEGLLEGEEILRLMEGKEV